MMLTCEGSVSGTCEYAFSKTMPSDAMRSIAGVSTSFAP
jgi:hypothetical protein